MQLYELSKLDAGFDLGFRNQKPTTGLCNWYAVYVKSRHELVACNELRARRIETFLPAAKRISQWKDRKKVIEYPLFPGYLFVQTGPSPEEFLNVLRTRGVVTLISLEPGKPTPILSEEINSLKLLVESGNEIDAYPYLKQGTRVRIKNGPLKGADGILSTRKNDLLFLVNVELLGRSVSVKVSAQEIEAA
jgi:transcription antitermination factor NusG